jgi:hypothetical protein
VSEIETGVVDCLKTLDPNRPIREADHSVAVLECPLRLEADIGSSSNPNIVFGGAVAALIANIEHSSRFDKQ